MSQHLSAHTVHFIVTPQQSIPILLYDQYKYLYFVPFNLITDKIISNLNEFNALTNATLTLTESECEFRFFIGCFTFCKSYAGIYF